MPQWRGLSAARNSAIATLSELQVLTRALFWSTLNRSCEEFHCQMFREGRGKGKLTRAGVLKQSVSEETTFHLCTYPSYYYLTHRNMHRLREIQFISWNLNSALTGLQVLELSVLWFSYLFTLSEYFHVSSCISGLYTLFQVIKYNCQSS